MARMAGASIPLTPAVHQMIDIGPVPRFAGAKAAIEFPIVRDMDTNMYERQDGSGLEIGSYAHRPILHDPEEIPSIEESALSPTELPFTEDDFDQQMEHALELMPEIVGDESRGREVRDQRPALADARRPADPGRDARGEGAVVGAPRSGSRRAPASAARWPSGWSQGESEIDLQASDVARFHEHQKTRRARRARAPRRGSTRPTGSSTRPSSGRRTATSGCRRSTRASRSWAPSSTRRRAGSARTGTSRTPPLVEEYGDRIAAARPSGTRAGGRRSSTPSTWPCATAPAMFDLTAFCDLRRRRAGRARRRCSASPCARWT